MKYAVVLENICKEYRLYERNFIDRFKDTFLPGSGDRSKCFTALSGINLKIQKGEILGIIGRNGAGKSTLLKIIAGITEPTSGSVRVNGRVVALLELRAGLNPEYTGRENIYFLSSLQGLRKNEIDEIFDSIVNFSELGDFIDVQVKKYSSGMKARLGFSVSININPDILILDEILSVGDELFREKCFLKMTELFESGRTVIFVTHSLNNIKQMCSRVILLKQGQIVKRGKPEKVISEYRRSMKSNHRNSDFLCLITRCRDEPFIQEFVDHYFNEGVDRIFIIDDNVEFQMPKKIMEDERIEIIKNKLWTEGRRNQMSEVNKVYKQVRRRFKWVISVDCDEFITAIRNKDKTIRDELETEFWDADCVKIPWIMMACNNREQDPEILLEELVYRWDHDIRHPHPYDWYKGRCRYDEIEVKCIFKTSKFTRILVHRPYCKNQESVKIVNGTDGSKATLDKMFHNLRNRDIENAYLGCFHFRIMSRESCRRKIKIFGKFNNLDLSDEPSYYSEEKIMSTDYPEILDETLKNKSIRRRMIND